MTISGLAQSIAIKRPRDAVRSARYLLKGIINHGTDQYCPICCKSTGPFAPNTFGATTRVRVVCPVCGSLDRHRLFWVFLQQRLSQSSQNDFRLLHLAPERCIEHRLHALIGDGYVTADLFLPRVKVRLDLSEIPFPAQSFDAIYLSHVLEYVPDDSRAIREMARVLKPQGWIALMTKTWSAPTLDSSRVTDRGERFRIFGDEDSMAKTGVRQYGPDLPPRLQSGGFNVSRVLPSDLLDAAQAARMGIGVETSELYLCTKPSASRAAKSR